MPTFAPHYRITFGGALTEPGGGAPDDLWVCAINAVLAGTDTIDLDGYCVDLAAALSTWFAAPSSHMSNWASLTTVKANLINAAGHYASGSTTHYHDIPSATPVMGGALIKDPQYVTTAVSWRTAITRGPGAHGRIYPPNNTMGESGTTLVPTAQQTSMAQAGAALLAIISNPSPAGGPPGSSVGNGHLVPVVASGVNATNTPITAVAVGGVKDVQRRRKNGIKERYQVVTL
jgi:hypothetical protein